MNQRDKILSALDRGKKLTGLDALKRFGCFRLGARIHELREDGHTIESAMVVRDGKHYSQYWKPGVKKMGLK